MPGEPLRQEEVPRSPVDVRDLSLLKIPSGSKVIQKRTSSSAQPMARQAEMSRIGPGVTPPGIDRAESRDNLPARIETIRDCEEQGHAARVYR